MIEYKCSKCGKIFSQKSNYDYHINRKRPCKINSGNSTKFHKIPQKLIEHAQESIENQQNSTKNPQKSTEIVNSENKVITVLKCNYCQKTFARSDSLNRHLLNSCKVKKEQENQKEELFNKLVNEMAEMKEIIKKNSDEINKLKTQNKEYAQKISKQSNIETQNNINNQQINNNNQNIQINNNVKILSFGKEDISHITDDLYKAILKKGMGSVPTLIEHIHFNKNKPENHNVYISNIRSNYAMIYDELNWKLKDQNEVVETLFDNINILEEKYDELLKDLSEPTINLLREIFDDKNEPSINNEIKKRIKLLLYNKKKIPEKTKEILETNKVDQIKQ